jgi:hypothetical protein
MSINILADSPDEKLYEYDEEGNEYIKTANKRKIK